MNPLLSGPSALDDTDEKTRMLLEWLRQQTPVGLNSPSVGGVEDRRNPFMAMPYTPNVNNLMNYNGTLGSANDLVSPEMRMRDALSGRDAGSTMPWNGQDDYDWRKSMSNHLQPGYDPDAKAVAELQSGKFPEQNMTREELEAYIEQYKKAYRDSLPGGGDSDLPTAPVGQRANDDIMNEMLR